jgi:hypothetical protein
MRGGKDRKDSTPSQVVVSPSKKRRIPKWVLIVALASVLAGLSFVGYDRFYDSSDTNNEPQTGEIDSVGALKETELTGDIPDDGKISFYLGTANALQTQGRLSEAMQVLNKAAAISSNNEQVNRGFAKFYALVGDAENRKKYEELAGSTVPDVPESETERVCQLSVEFKCP